MTPGGPIVLHAGYLPATVEEPRAAGRPHRGQASEAGALLKLREKILARITDRAEESRYPPTPQRIVHDVRQVMPEDSIVCLDNGMYKIRFAATTVLRWRTRYCSTMRWQPWEPACLRPSWP
jgi:acetolactate synthase-1/2/3 large subunit